MSEQKLVSPLLDGFQMGEPISSHDGVCCYPALKENSDNKYIVKILSIPASQGQLDALLLTGAFQDAASALNYFKELTDGVVQEIRLHQKLARSGGFVPCESWQVIPMDNNQLGYDVYLLTPYRKTLEQHLEKGPMTHLEAVNLGLDLSAALTISRRTGHLYVDLKPSNIFVSDDRKYQIGDLGFISMDSIQYASLPTKYLSRYSAPEQHDIFATVSRTADIYALGLILYQVYNDGTLPFDTQAPADPLAPPANADPEMAEIILKACHPDPAQRWQDPTEMGQALVAYMQRNTINDVPIQPPVVEEIEEPEAEEEEAPAEETATVPAEEKAETAAEETAESAEEEAAAEEESVEPAAEESSEVPEETEAEDAEADAPAEEPAEEDAEEDSEEPAESQEEAADVEQEVMELLSEEPAEEDTALEVDADEISQETSEILAQADELAAHEIPEPVVVPEIKLPVEEEPEIVEETPAAEDTDSDEEDEIPLPIPEMPKKKRGKKIIVSLIALLLLAALGCGGKYYYDNYYLVPVNSIVLNGDADEITAQVDVAFDEAMLTAVCTDTYGNTVTAPVQQGVAQFTGLKAGTQYTVTLTVDGFYKLCGNNSASFTTAGQTTIVSISAVTGPENGSVILSFTVDGTDPENWTVEYTADGEEEAQTLDFTGHVVTITGLNVDTNYTFKLRPTQESEVAVVGTDTMGFTTSKLIQAQNVSIAAFLDGVMNIRWDAPADSQVAEWTVRCTDGGDYDQTLVVTDCTAQFSGVEEGKTYTVEILAQGMTQSVRTDLSLKQTTVSNVSCTPMGTSALRVTWEYEGEAPENRWTVTYSINGGEAKTIISNTNVADLSPLIPGASYEVSVAGMSAAYQAPAADRFEAFGISADDITGSLCVTPGTSNWDHSHVETYTKDFSAGKSISAVVYINTKVEEFESADVDVLYIIRDSKGKVIPELASVKTMNWATMWKDRYFYPTVSDTPDKAGSYTLEIYFNGDLALSKPFTMK